MGTNIRKPIVDITSEDFSKLMVTNFESVFHTSQLAYPLLKASGAGSVVFISSVSGFVSLKSMSVQGATKGNFDNFSRIPIFLFKHQKLLKFQYLLYLPISGAINQLTRNLACEWAKDNIRSNAVAPWYIKTSMVEQVSFVSISRVIGIRIATFKFPLYQYPKKKKENLTSH